MKISQIKDIDGITLIGDGDKEEYEVQFTTKNGEQYIAIKTCAFNIYHTTYEADKIIDQ